MESTFYLPTFKGFYGSHFEDFDFYSEIDYINECRTEKGLKPLSLKYDDLEFDYKQYYIDISRSITDTVFNFLNENNFIKKIDFIEIQSPQYYNYSNDDILVSGVFTKKNIASIKKYVKENFKQFDIFIKENFNSRSGFYSFYSFYSDSASYWFEQMNNFELLNELEIQHILLFICDNEGFDLYDSLYNGFSDVPYCPNVTNLEELINR
jgi:hypothetical protein